MEEVKQEKNFVHLHNHTEFSLLDGIARYKDLIKKAKKLNMPAVAITDHGNMYVYLKFYTECLVQGIKPIIGCEFYIANDYLNKVGKQKYSHLVLLAKNNEGLKNLFKLDSIAFVDGFHYKPRIDYNLLEKHSEGLICLSACLAGDIPKLLLNNEWDEAEKLALRLKNMFAPGDFYIELQNHNIPEQLDVLPKLDALAKKIGVKTVGTNDVHYINKSDAELQDILMCVQQQKTVDDPMRLKFQTEEFYFKTREEMETALSGFTDCLDTTLEIAEKCNVIIQSKGHSYDECHVKLGDEYILPANKNFIPHYENPDGTSNYEYLRKVAEKGLQEKYPEVTKEIRDRFEYELDTINSLGFVDYFLVVWDYINWARSQNISVGPGRGSGAGSIIAYTTGITDIDPIKYNLFFERFINKDRVSMPDFDIDFCKDRRMEVIDYARRKYSASHVAHIIAYGTMATRAVVKDVGRVLNVSFAERDKITKMIPKKLPDGIKKPPVLKYYLGISGEEGMEKYILPELREIYDSDETMQKVLDIASKLEGCPRNTTTHACGVLIAPEAVSNVIPLQRNGDEITTQLTGAELESLGLLKMDFLGLRNLTDIEACTEMIKRNTGKVIDFKKLGVDDPKVYEFISTGNTDTIFQIESGGFKKHLKDLKPDSIEDIIAAVSLYRPGPMDEFPTYIRNKHNPDKVEYAHPILEPILNVTYGCIVYQEQVMKIVQDMGGYSLGQADNVRRIMGKKKVEKMAEERQKFIYGYNDPTGKHSICGALSKGVSEEVANKVFSQMENFAKYAFNKSHAAAYSHVTYMTAWLRYYYPVFWLSAYLNNRITNIDKVKQYVAYARGEGIEVLPPDINKSDVFFNAVDGKIRYGLCALKGVGEGVCKEIIAERERNGEFKDLVDFIKRTINTTINKRCYEAFIFSGAFDCFGKKRSQLMAVYDTIIERCKADAKKQLSGQFSIFEMLGEQDMQSMYVQYPKIADYDAKSRLKFEKEVLGLYMSGHPLDDYKEKLSEFTVNSTMFIAEEVPVQSLESADTDSTEDYIDEEETANVETVKVYEHIENEQPVVGGGIVSEIRKLNSKSSGKEMAVLTIEDLYGAYSVLVFPNIWAKYKSKVNEDDLITVKGKISIKEGDDAVILCDSIELWTDNKETSKIIKEERVDLITPKKHVVKLYLKFDVTNTELSDKIRDIIAHYKGNVPVVVKCSAENKIYSLGTVNYCPHLVNELKGYIAEEFIVYK